MIDPKNGNIHNGQETKNYFSSNWRSLVDLPFNKFIKLEQLKHKVFVKSSR